MGLLDDFLIDDHIPRHAMRSAWGADEPNIRDGLADPDGHGWQIRREQFEHRLRSEAIRRGASIATARANPVRQISGGWIVSLGRSRQMTARLVIDASGRRSRFDSSARERAGKLCCAWLRARDASLPPGIVQVEAEVDGWWYCTPLPGRQALLA